MARFKRATNHDQDPERNHQGSTRAELMTETSREAAQEALKKICVCASAGCTDRGNFLNSNQLKWCSACHALMYCSVECQRNDWRAGHRQVCTRREFRRKSVEDHLDYFTAAPMVRALSDGEDAMHESVD